MDTETRTLLKRLIDASQRRTLAADRNRERLHARDVVCPHPDVSPFTCYSRGGRCPNCREAEASYRRNLRKRERRAQVAT